MIKPTIYEVLRDKLGREPSHRELCDDVERILTEAHEQLKTKSRDRSRAA